jgi:hypothetical protein
MQIRIPNYVFSTLLMVIYLLLNAIFIPAGVSAITRRAISSGSANSNIAMDSIDLVEKASHILIGTVESLKNIQNGTTR